LLATKKWKERIFGQQLAVVGANWLGGDSIRGLNQRQTMMFVSTNLAYLISVL
jgi:hypothetical protein